MGKDPLTVAEELKVSLRGIIVDPDLNVTILKTAPVRIDVVGEVKTPGNYELTRDRGVVTALAAAGWLTDFARRDRVFVVRRGLRTPTEPAETEQRIRFSAEDLTTAEPHAARFRLRDGDVVVVE